jgi:hypothetical protein
LKEVAYVGTRDWVVELSRVLVEAGRLEPELASICVYIGVSCGTGVYLRRECGAKVLQFVKLFSPDDGA